MDLTSTPSAALDSTLTPPAASTFPHGNDMFPRQLLAAMLAFRGGDFTARMPNDLTGIEGKIADAFNDIAGVTGLARKAS
jgi:hypothetical protein